MFSLLLKDLISEFYSDCGSSWTFLFIFIQGLTSVVAYQFLKFMHIKQVLNQQLSQLNRGEIILTIPHKVLHSFQVEHHKSILFQNYAH